MKKQSFLKGSIILIISAVVAKAVGALFKIPLTNMLGGVGMSYFSCAYGLFLPVYALTATGLTTAVAKLTAENCAYRNYRNVRKINRVSLALFSLVGLAGSVLVAVLSKPFAEKVTACPKAELSILMIAPCVLFGCITAVYRGSWEGMRNMYPTAVSQVIEAVIRLTAGLFLCSYVLNHPERILAMLPEGTDIHAAAAAAAVLGISLSTLAGTLFLYIRGTGTELCNTALSSQPEESTRSVIKSLFKILIPVALGSIVTNLTSLIDLATIIRCLDRTIKNYPELLTERYGLEGIQPEDISDFIYGSFTGLAVTVFNLIPSVTNMFGKGILPSIAESWTKSDRNAVEKLSENVIAATAFIAVPSGLGICFLANPILLFIFPNRIRECAVSEQSLAFLGIAVIFLALSFPIFSCLQATGRADIPVKLMLAGVAVKLAGNLVLITIPEINVAGAAISTLLCYFIIFVFSAVLYQKYAGIKIHPFRTLLPSLFSGTFCAVTAWLVYPHIPLKNLYALPLAVCAGGTVYLLCTFIIKVKGRH